MDALKLRRKTIKTGVTNLKKVVDAYNPAALTKNTVEIHQEKLNKLEDELSKNFNDLAAILPDTDFDMNATYYTDLGEIIDGIKIKIRDTLDILRPAVANPTPPPINPGPTPGASASVPDTSIRLAPIEVPHFSGDLHDWMNFHDLFIAIVDKNPKLSAAQKLQYLKTSLKGEAARHLGSYQVRDANYAIALKSLETRYQNQREIVFDHIQRLVNQASVQPDNPNSLRNLVDTTNECIRSLTSLNRNPDKWDDLLLYLILQKLDLETRRLWELSLTNTDVPRFEELQKFLEQHSTAPKSIASTKPKSSSSSSNPRYNTRSQDDKSKTRSHHASTYEGTCPVCSGPHSSFKCETYMKLPVSERRNTIQKKALCFNCLRSGHSVANCKSGGCQVCQKKHHTTLHLPSHSNAGTEETKSALITTASNISSHIVLLTTAIVTVCDNYGNRHKLRAFLDSGSQANFISKSCARKLQLTKSNVNINVTGLGSNSVGTVKHKVNLKLSPHFNSDYEVEINAFVLPQVTGIMPSNQFDISKWDYLHGLQLADPEFNIPAPIDLLLGASVIADTAMNNCCRGEESTPLAHQSQLGWLVYGNTPSKGTHSIQNMTITLSLDESVERFWKLEEIPMKHIMSTEESAFLDHYAKTHARDKSGRYIVSFPLQNHIQLGDSKATAQRRLLQLERRFDKNSKLKTEYSKCIQEYLDLGHMVVVPDNELNLPDDEVFYLPHHPVFKESSTSTSLRIVFDGSCKTTTGFSLNDKMLNGPVVQSELFVILLKFRRWIIALVGDIVKMYRQIMHILSDTNFLRILWRFDSQKAIKAYKHLRVTFGSKSAPALATQTINQLADDHTSEFPVAAEVLKKDTYVDDVATGRNSVTDTVQLQSQLDKLTRLGGFELSKWISNSPEVMSAIPEANRGSYGPLNFDSDKTVKTLGLYWNPTHDSFTYNVRADPNPKTLTKRFILSDTAQLFDPLGLLSPVTIIPKMFLQQLWSRNLEWDQPIPAEIIQPWLNYRRELPVLQELAIPRCVIPENPSNLQLHGFSDASERAFGAAVYVRTVDRCKKVHMHLLTAKTKVAPLKSTSLPRLELCAALLLAELFTVVYNALETRFDELHCWTDSTIVLNWIRSPPHKWKTFISNRVSKIQESQPNPLWHHIPGLINPADFPSRGVMPSELKQSHPWWTGPDFLHINPYVIPAEPCMIFGDKTTLEEKPERILVHHALVDLSHIQRYSSLNMLKRITAYCLRFIQNSKAKATRVYGELCVSELTSAMNRLVKLVQQAFFPEELTALTNNQQIPTKSKLLSLTPFLDQDGLIRVGGRLKKAAHIPFAVKHPLILPNSHHLTTLIVRHYHITNLHAGHQQLHYLLQQHFWIINARKVINYNIKRCKPCAIMRASAVPQIMGNLPKSRVTPSLAFSSTRVDYCGPYLLRPVKGRSPKLFKCWIALFICFVTRAIHLELVSDMTSDCFLAALRRFVSRRRKPKEIFSDCGSNFVAANKEMKDFLQLVKSEDHNQLVHRSLADKGINWIFNPPAAPHMGGLWEAGVKSTKYHLKRVLGSTPLNFEEFGTLLCEVESCLNSRPLCPASNDPEDLTALSPAHFLTFGSIDPIPEPSYLHLKVNRLSRWQLIQRLLQEFWKRWNSEYLSRLQQRPKWWSIKPNFKVGTLVLLKDDRLPPQEWNLARITEVFPGDDNVVRVVKVKTSSGEYKRPIIKICALPFAEEEED